ncbi:MAG: DoxX family protein [Methyloprofundus sp.]|nr:DoxX family protein [Methyloprofundus sp.]MDT8425740.1 DoxX family protein [Methyloprofundus sp.]
MINFLNKLHDYLDLIRALEFLGPLALRLYLFPIMWMAGMHKVTSFEDTVAWFGNTEWGLGLPLPALMAGLVAGTEVLGAVFLLLGFAVRWISIPLFIIMVVATYAVHLPNGWLAVSEESGFFATDRTIAAIERLSRAKEILQQYGDYEWLTEQGSFVVLNNGAEFAVTYAIMLLMLIFVGGGRYLSLDYWIAKKFRRQVSVYSRF